MSKQNLTRHKQIIVRVTPEEKDFIMKKVAKSGCRTINLYALLMMTVGSIKNVDLSHYHELANEVNKIGANINQIVHVANASGNISSEEIKKLQERMDEIWLLLKSSLSEVQSTSR
jgi:hypothetical protein